MDAVTSSPMTGAVRAYFHVLAKPTGAVCNLDCKYCFFLSKQALYPESDFRMADDLLEIYIRQLLESQPEQVTIAWQGGEPTLMGLEFFERGMGLVKKYSRSGQTIEHTIQTNGTRLDDEWCAFFKQHGFLVGLSVDGPRELHDLYRVDKGGKGIFDQVVHGWELLKKHGVECNILCTVHAGNAEHAVEIYRFFRDDLSAQFMQFIPIVERGDANLIPLANLGWGPRGSDARPLYVQSGNRVTDRSVEPKQLGRFLIDVFDEWVRRDVGRVYVQMFDTTLGAHVGQYSLCVFSPTCGDAVALEHTGDLYSCDHFVEPGYLLGNIREEHMANLVGSARQRKFGLDKQATLPKFCRECDVLYACNGGCPKDRFATTSDGEAGLNYLCAGYKRFFEYVEQPMQMMAGLLEADRAPAEIMQWYAGQDAVWKAEALKVGRNEACVCGSGRKGKHCHGAG
ncbi:MAG: anaerobic sulfatase maturase [Acidobacteriota bacterium]|nr:anaerobic sulfatase maturase [Acidobacteriota bacterium]